MTDEILLNPDRIVDDNTKLWRFKAEVVGPPATHYAMGYDNPVEVWRDSKLLGYCSLSWDGRGVLLAECALEYEVPERLEVENGKRFWLDPVIHNMNINYLVLTEQDIHHVQPIGSPLL